MAFSKKTWLQRIVEYPSRRRLNETGTQLTYDVSRAEGDVIQEGDGFTVKNMNDLEERISKAFQEQGYYGTCTTAAATVAKTATIDGFVLNKGVRVLIMFTDTNTADSPTLNINGTGDIIIKSANNSIATKMWRPKQAVEFVYDGTNWQVLQSGYATKNYYGLTKLTDTYATKIEGADALGGIAASQNSLYEAYDALNTNLLSVKGKTLLPGDLDISFTNSIFSSAVFSAMPSGSICEWGYNPTNGKCRDFISAYATARLTKLDTSRVIVELITTTSPAGYYIKSGSVANINTQSYNFLAGTTVVSPTT